MDNFTTLHFPKTLMRIIHKQVIRCYSHEGSVHFCQTVSVHFTSHTNLDTKMIKYNRPLHNKRPLHLLTEWPILS